MLDASCIGGPAGRPCPYPPATGQRCRVHARAIARHRRKVGLSAAGGPSEKALLEQVRQLAALARGRTYHTHNSRGSEPGFPDVVLLVPPRAWFLELKTETGVVKSEQAEWIDALRACGLDARIVRPSDLDDLAAEVLR